MRGHVSAIPMQPGLGHTWDGRGTRRTWREPPLSLRFAFWKVKTVDPQLEIGVSSLYKPFAGSVLSQEYLCTALIRSPGEVMQTSCRASREKGFSWKAAPLGWAAQPFPTVTLLV